MLIKKSWTVREATGHSPLGDYRIEEWEGWYLLGMLPVYRRVVGIRFESKPRDPAPSKKDPPSIPEVH